MKAGARRPYAYSALITALPHIRHQEQDLDIHCLPCQLFQQHEVGGRLPLKPKLKNKIN